MQATLTGAVAPEPPRIQYPKGSRATAQNACGTVPNADKGEKDGEGFVVAYAGSCEAFKREVYRRVRSIGTDMNSTEAVTRSRAEINEQ